MSDGTLDASVTLEEVFAVLSAKRVPLAPELAGYLVLEVAERVDPAAGGIHPERVFVGEEGTVVFVRRRGDPIAGDAEESIRLILGRLLEACGALTPALSAAARRPSGAGLSALAGELETALIPVNRAAGRRALGRLSREVRRVKLGLGRNALPSTVDPSPAAARSNDLPPTVRRPEVAASRADEAPTARRATPKEVLQPRSRSEWPDLPTTEFEPQSPPKAPASTSQADVDALIAQFSVSSDGEKQHARALGTIVGLEPTPPPAGTSLSRVARDSDVEALLALGSEPPSRAAPTVVLPATARSKQSQAADSPLAPMPPARASLPSEPALRSSRGPWLAFFAIAALLGAAYVLLKLRPTEPAGGAFPAPATSEPAIAPKIAPACNATLVVTGVPQHAEVLLRAGQAPLDVEKMPVGARLEFVATAEGYVPKRVVVPAGVPWDTGADGKPRFEAAVQLDKSKSKAGVDPWPSAEPGSEVGGQGPPGTVRVVATPRGSEVWMLAGIGPEARVDQLRCDRDLDVLVAGPTTLRKRLHVAAGEFEADARADAGGRTATRIAHVSAE